MTTPSPAQTVQRLFPLPAEGKSAQAAALFADSVSFSIPHPPGLPWVPEVDSPDGMRTFFEPLGTRVRTKEFELRQVIAEGDDVVFHRPGRPLLGSRAQSGISPRRGPLGHPARFRGPDHLIGAGAAGAAPHPAPGAPTGNSRSGVEAAWAPSST
ncbi:nuclear transport factor 2 family protein [Streptomyces virginiae]|uniref:nuclear transport factor 2 family protein n=1 Tax=Streptomyces virginiae TaxID=1961 RepID=UPI0036632CD9